MLYWIALWISFQIASAQSVGELYVLDDNSSRYNLARITSNSPSNYEITDVNTSLNEGNYKICATLSSYDACFGYNLIKYPLSYELEAFLLNGTLSRFSFKLNKAVTGIVPIVTEINEGPMPEITKLKRITKTYESKRKSEQKGTGIAAFEEDTNEEEISFIQKNWKYIVIGILLYMMSKGNNSAQNKESKEE